MRRRVNPLVSLFVHLCLIGAGVLAVAGAMEFREACARLNEATKQLQTMFFKP